MSKLGRPTKLTKEIQEEIVKLVSSGNYVETTCAFVGLEKKTFYNWLKRGHKELERMERENDSKPKRSEAPYVEFLHTVKKAEAQSEIRDVMIIGKAAQSNWQAAAWRLERKNFERWGRKDKLNAELSHSGHIDSKQHHEVSITQQLSMDEKSKELLKELWRRNQEIAREEE